MTAWEVLYDQHPFPGRTVLELASAVQLGDIIEPRDPLAAPRGLLPILRRGLEDEREQRWPSMADLLANFVYVEVADGRLVLHAIDAEGTEFDQLLIEH